MLFKYWDPPVLRVGAVSLDLLKRITFQPFGKGAPVALGPSQDYFEQRMRGLQIQAQTWWKANKSKSEFQVLQESVQKGDPTYQATITLARRYPDNALPIIKQAMLSPKGRIPGEVFTQALQKLHSKAAKDLLRRINSGNWPGAKGTWITSG